MLTCAIQFGSSRIMAVAAQKNMQNGTLSNIEIESEAAQDCISHGYVANVEQTAMHLRSIIQKLSNRMRTPITSAYVGVGGMSLHSLIQQPSVQLPDYDVLSSEPLTQGGYQLIIGKKVISQHVQAAMERAGIRLMGVIALPQATACILTAEEREQGCLLVDMGAGTTTVSVYCNGDLQHLAVIPLGGQSVTLDIASAGCTLEEAERIKTEWSDVSKEVSAETSSNNPSAIFADKTLPIPQSKLNNIALCRYEELAANILNQVEISGCKDKLQAGCILTGGASLQRGLTSLLSRRLGIAHIETRAFRERAMIGSERKPHLTNLLALLTFCADDCTKPFAATGSTTPKPASAATPRPATTAQKPIAPKPATKPAVKEQETLDFPEEPEEEKKKEGTKQEPAESHSIKQSVGRFIKDLITGQDQN